MEPLNILEFLTLVKEKTESEGAYFSKQGPVIKHIEAGYIEMVGRGQDGCLYKLTELGNTILEKSLESEPVCYGEHFFPILKNVDILPKKRIHKRVKPNYPYDLMEIGDAFFVACDNAAEEALVRSSVNSANKKYGIEIGVKEFKPTKKAETIQVAEYEYTRLFISRKCYQYEVFGSYIVPYNGMLVYRVDLCKK